MQIIAIMWMPDILLQSGLPVIGEVQHFMNVSLNDSSILVKTEQVKFNEAIILIFAALWDLNDFYDFQSNSVVTSYYIGLRQMFYYWIWLFKHIQEEIFAEKNSIDW